MTTIPVHEHIFDDNRPFAACHAATLATLPNGRFFAAWFGGSYEKHPDVAIWGAERESHGWSAPRLLAKVRDEAHWNPVLFTEPSGRLWLFFKIGANPHVWETWVMQSDDNGATWNEPRELILGDQGGRGPVKNRPIVLANGAWLAPASLEQPGRWDVFVDHSSDAGQSWISSNLLKIDPAVTGPGVIQPAIWETQPGHVHLLARSTCGHICRADSPDGGRTWSPVRPIRLPNNNSGLDLACMHDGTLVLAYNPVSGDWAARTPLSLACSSNNGVTWNHLIDLETEPGEYSYPTIIPTDDAVAVVYTWQRERIAFWMGKL